jgi:hypothetical protein
MISHNDYALFFVRPFTFSICVLGYRIILIRHRSAASSDGRSVQEAFS